MKKLITLAIIFIAIIVIGQTPPDSTQTDSLKLDTTIKIDYFQMQEMQMNKMDSLLYYKKKK